MAPARFTRTPIESAAACPTRRSATRPKRLERSTRTTARADRSAARDEPLRRCVDDPSGWPQPQQGLASGRRATPLVAKPAAQPQLHSARCDRRPERPRRERPSAPDMSSDWARRVHARPCGASLVASCHSRAKLGFARCLAALRCIRSTPLHLRRCHPSCMEVGNEATSSKGLMTQTIARILPSPTPVASP
jgi:hypothetical protein